MIFMKSATIFQHGEIPRNLRLFKYVDGLSLPPERKLLII